MAGTVPDSMYLHWRKQNPLLAYYIAYVGKTYNIIYIYLVIIYTKDKNKVV